MKLFLVIFLFLFTKDCYANYLALLCNIRLTTDKNGEIISQNFKTEIKVTFNKKELFIIPTNTSLLPVTTTEGNNKSVKNLSVENKWHLINTEQLADSIFNTTTLIIERNSGNLSYESIWIGGNFLFFQKSTASGECEKIDIKKRKF